MTTPHRIWTFVGIVGAVAGIIDVARQHDARKKDRETEPEPVDPEPVEPEPEPEPEPDMLDLNTPRDRIVAWAESQEGESDHSPYWLSAIGRPAQDPDTDWCGAFVLAALHRQGLAIDRQWALGKGLEATLPLAKRTKSPQRGDIAYYKKNQHVAIVADVHDGLVRLVNGNGAGGRVTITERPSTDAAAYYDIGPYIDQANEPLTVEVVS